jgi:hypothetical protein
MVQLEQDPLGAGAAEQAKAEQQAATAAAAAQQHGEGSSRVAAQASGKQRR